MYAIIQFSGKQFKVEENKFIYTYLLDEEVGEEFDIKEVLLCETDNGEVKIGQPTLKDAFVKVKLLSNLKDDKVIVFKKKRRKGYKVKNGHRQHLSKLLIQKIVV